MTPQNENPSPDDDWLKAVRNFVESEMPSIEFNTLRPGDVLVVYTRNTVYRLDWLGNDQAEISSNRADRPKGRVRIHGCALGKGSSIAIDRLFCGGGLEYASDNGALIHRTSAIRELRLKQGLQKSTFPRAMRRMLKCFHQK